jgi:hypothetical protein
MSDLYPVIKAFVSHERFTSPILLQIHFSLSFPSASRYFLLLQQEHIVSSFPQAKGYAVLNPADPLEDEDRIILASYDMEKIKERGFAYEIGAGMPYNDQKAFVFFRQAYTFGDKEAGYVLAYLYLYGIGTEKDSEQGLSILKALAARRDSRAICSLAKFSYEGTFLPLDQEGGIKELRTTSPFSDYATKILEGYDKGERPLRWPPLFQHPRVKIP